MICTERAYNTCALKRDLPALTNSRFDLLVVGAGIYGATIAWDAAQRGLSVALIDRGDFGGGTSANSAKTVHGGIRALQTGQLRELRSFVRERRTLCRIAPHLVHRLPFVIPTYSGITRHRLTMRAAFRLYDLLARDRNDRLDPSKQLPASRLVSRAECLALNPMIAPNGVTGGIIWYDCQMYNADRVVLAFVHSAVDAGAAAANYLEVTGWISDGKRVSGVTAQDRTGLNVLDIRARLIINATGPGSSTLTRNLPLPARPGAAPGLSQAMNLITRSVTQEYALGGLTGSRFLFALPWRGVSIIGTSHDRFEPGQHSGGIKEADVRIFLRQVNDAFPLAALTIQDVQLVHSGLLPATDASGQQLLKTSLIRDHRSDGLEGLMSVVGVRYTTARRTAELVVDRVFSLLGQRPPPCRTAVTPITGGDIGDSEHFFAAATEPHDGSVAAATRRRLALSYGSRQGAVLRLMHDDPALATPLSDKCSVTRGEILHAARHEMAIRLSDAVLRRTESGSAGHPGRPALEEAGHVMAVELGWTASHRQAELGNVEQTYRWSQ